ncbi:hypothetical protein [Gorillibacterium sp. sgz5001074]
MNCNGMVTRLNQLPIVMAGLVHAYAADATRLPICTHTAVPIANRFLP